MVHRPKWFKDGEVFVSYASTVGINKDGEELYVIDPATGDRTNKIDDQVSVDVAALIAGEETLTGKWVGAPIGEGTFTAVPVYFDDRSTAKFDDLMKSPGLSGFSEMTLGDLIDAGKVVARAGHGSPSADMRTGAVPYIKVSDIRAGQVNINPTNRVPEVVAHKFWKGSDSHLSAYDLITPIRTSKNIGDFAVLMPGQQRVVLTKEVLVLHAQEDGDFDNFYLLWAMSLEAVRRQWDRIVFMQTNREDVGMRYREIRVPVAPDRATALRVSSPFRDYYLGSQEIRNSFLEYLTDDGRHHIFLSSAEAVDEEIAAETEELSERGLGQSHSNAD